MGDIAVPASLPLALGPPIPALKPTVFGKKPSKLYAVFTVAQLSVRCFLGAQRELQSPPDGRAYFGTKILVEIGWRWSASRAPLAAGLLNAALKPTVFGRKPSKSYAIFTVAQLSVRCMRGSQPELQSPPDGRAYFGTKIPLPEAPTGSVWSVRNFENPCSDSENLDLQLSPQFF